MCGPSRGGSSCDPPCFLKLTHCRLANRERAARLAGRRARIHRRDKAHDQTVPALPELCGRQLHRDVLTADGLAEGGERASSGAKLDDPGRVPAVEVAVDLELEPAALSRYSRLSRSRERGPRLQAQPQTGAARGDAALRLLEGLAHDREARLRRAVDVVQARLPLLAARLVEHVEEEHPLDGRLAESELDRLLVALSLNSRRDRLRRCRLAARVLPCLLGRDRRLDPVLVVDDRDRRAGLRRPVEGLTEDLYELVVVRDRDG